ncbi:DUF1573 domain-containing protein [Candidatus Saccharibacteria bacterium]|nr:DUF1573 domain-containing protein [Candidatus Saccharibacteria bacterium]
MNNKTLIATLIGFTLIIFVGGIYLAGKSNPPELNNKGNPKVEILGEKTHSWGEIDIEGGNVEKIFKIRNVGDDPLEVTNFKTSCMCTEAQISIGDDTSPAFGMHTRSGWKGSIQPGETADIRVVFDPLFHGPQGTGPITRLVSFNTNDSSNSTVEFRLSGNVVRVEN